MTQPIVLTPQTPEWQLAWRPDTQALHTGYASGKHQRSAAVPIYQSTSYAFDSAQHGADLFDFAELGYIYARTGNPTLGVLEQRIAALEGGAIAIAVASGMAAIDIALGTLAATGDEVLIASQLYGGTHKLITEVLKSRGVGSRIVGKDDFDALAAAISPRTKAVFVESVGNPSGALADLRRIADIAHAAGVALVVDNTVPSPLQLRPIDWGADIVIHSATKVIGGHGNAIGGVIVDSGRFDWSAHAARYPQFSTPEPALHNTVFTEKFPGLAFYARARTVLLRHTGAALAAHSAFLLLQGLETLALRQDRITANTRRVIGFLQQQPQVERIHHVSLPDHPDHALAQRYLQGGGVPGIVSFELRGGHVAARQFYDALRLFLRLVNIGDSKSLASIPAETTHHLLTDAELAQAGIAPGLVRLSIGIEHPDDLIDDLRHALAHATHVSSQAAPRADTALTDRHLHSIEGETALSTPGQLAQEALARAAASSASGISPAIEQLPVIDLQTLRNPSKRAAALRHLAVTAREIGFFYIVGHGIDTQLWQGIQQQTREFFARPDAEKQRLAMVNSPHFRGYTAVNGEITRNRPDRREQLDFAEDLPAIVPGPDVPAWKRLQGPNQWPEGLPQFRPTVQRWLDSTHALALELVRHFLAALQLPEDALHDLTRGDPAHRLKLVHYPGAESSEESQGVGAHKDGGVLSLLLQDNAGGLQVETSAGWIDVTPLENAFVVNIGEILELVTNGYLRANVHRVKVPKAGVDRYSVAYFLQARLDAGAIPLLQLPPELAALARGPESDPDNPLFRHVGENAIKGRLRSHLDVTERFYPEQFAKLKQQASERGQVLKASAY